MKKAPKTIAAVSIYTAFEGIFLTSFVTPNNRQISPTAYQAFVGWSQFVLIPGMAILFSRLMYGPRGWRKRAITILAAGSLGVFLLLFGVIGAAFVIGWTASVYPWLGAVSAAATIGGIVLGINWIVRKTADRSIRMESERWLEERRQHTPIDRRRKDRAIRWALWIPSAMVLVVGLSFIQVWGLLSHAAQPRVGHLSRYRIEVPLTWVVLSSDWKPTNGDVWAAGLAGRGSALFGLFETR